MSDLSKITAPAASSRRSFLRIAGLLSLLPAVPPAVLARILAAAETDDEILQHLFASADARRLFGSPMGRLVAGSARGFLGAPYAAGTLEGTAEERLVVNLREFDCVTLVESSLALARCIATRRQTMGAFAAELTRIRYRGGVIDGYPSRLHYFSDWIDDNEQKGVVRNVTRELGGVPQRERLTFMTSNRDRYPRLADPTVLAAIGRHEKEISAREHAFLPLRRLAAAEGDLQEGDILAVTTSVPGLDIAHVGLVVLDGSARRFLHAPLRNGTVRIAAGKIAPAIAARETNTGVMIARPLQPPSVE